MLDLRFTTSLKRFVYKMVCKTNYLGFIRFLPLLKSPGVGWNAQLNSNKRVHSEGTSLKQAFGIKNTLWPQEEQE